MKNKDEYVFIIHVGEVTKLVRDCVQTLRQTNPSCDICLFTIPDQTNNLELLEKYNVKISSIARGIAIGDDIEYADEITLGAAISSRIPYIQ